MTPEEKEATERKLNAMNTNPYAIPPLEQRIAQLEKENRINKIKAESCKHLHTFCPDCRDKVSYPECIRCTERSFGRKEAEYDLRERIAELEQCFKDATDITIAQCDTENKLRERIKELERELATAKSQLACAVDALGWFTGEDAVLEAEVLIEDDNESFPVSHNPQSVKFIDEFGTASLMAIDFINAKQALNNLAQASKERDERLKRDATLDKLAEESQELGLYDWGWGRLYEKGGDE